MAVINLWACTASYFCVMRTKSNEAGQGGAGPTTLPCIKLVMIISVFPARL